MAHLYVFFEMRFDLGTFYSGERSLPFGLLVPKSFLVKLSKSCCVAVLPAPKDLKDRENILYQSVS